MMHARHRGILSSLQKVIESFVGDVARKAYLLTFGFLLIRLAIFVGGIGVLILLAALLVGLANLDNWVYPFIVTGLAALGGAGLLGYWAVNLFKGR